MHDHAAVRTTLDLDEDVLAAVKELATERGTTAGKLLSDLARKALALKRSPTVRNGVALLAALPCGSRKTTLELVNRLRDEA